MENNAVEWKYFELSYPVPGMDEISAIRQNANDFIIEFVGWNEKDYSAKVIFSTLSVMSFRKMKREDTYEFSNGDGSYAGLVSVSDNSHFLEWYKKVRFVNSEEIKGMAKLRAYALYSERDVMEIISFAAPKVFYSGSNIAIEKGDKEKE